MFENRPCGYVIRCLRVKDVQDVQAALEVLLVEEIPAEPEGHRLLGVPRDGACQHPAQMILKSLGLAQNGHGIQISPLPIHVLQCLGIDVGPGLQRDTRLLGMAVLISGPGQPCIDHGEFRTHQITPFQGLGIVELSDLVAFVQPGCVSLDEQVGRGEQVRALDFHLRGHAATGEQDDAHQGDAIADGRRRYVLH